jgi:hypothetical protein
MIALVIAGLCGGCLDSTPYGPTGFHCDSDGDCESPATCFRQRCSVPSPIPLKPGPENTGAPPDLVLQSSGGLNITVDGTVVEGLDIQGCIQVRAKNVTLRKSKVRCTGYYTVEMFSGASNLLLEDVELDGGGNVDGYGLVLNGGTARRLNIHGMGRPVVLGGNTRLEGSYLHDLPLGSSSLSAVGAQGGTNLRVFGNRVEMPDKAGGSAIVMGANFAPLTDVRIERNWLYGGSAVVKLGDGAQGSSDVIASHNRIGRLPGSIPFSLGSGAQQFENVYDDNDEPIAP